MKSEEVDKDGREFRAFDEASFPGSNNLWIAGAVDTISCNIEIEISVDALTILLDKVERNLENLELESIRDSLGQIRQMLPCVKEDVPSAVLARMLFLEGMSSWYINSDKGALQNMFEQALVVEDLKWDDAYGNALAAIFLAVKERVEDWREPESGMLIQVNVLFEYNELLIDGRRGATALLPGTHLLQWEALNGQRYGRVFSIESHDVKYVTLLDAGVWKESILHGPYNALPYSDDVVRAYLLGVHDGGNVVVLNLKDGKRNGYRLVANAESKPIVQLTLPAKVEMVGNSEMVRTRSSVRAKFALFGTTAVLGRYGYGGGGFAVHFSKVGGRFEVGLGGSFMFASYNENTYMLPGLRLGARYVFSPNHVVRPFVGAYGTFEVNEGPIVGGEVCGGIKFHVNDHFSPIVSLCGGAGMPGMGRAGFSAGIELN